MLYLEDISPKQVRFFIKVNDITGLHPNKRPGLGIGRTFQNLALFNHMTVLENIYVGRHHLLKNSFLSGQFIGSWVHKKKKQKTELKQKEF